ncbi:hypothetical protein [Nocardioides pantholopis]|uniref:hypothetical protein n=1 Tax=Nocardioides pantholopis TaxID=2483798 RepID=UPI000FDA3CA7|nr:hypothetical protein [Nocardioides pantholopis]
MSDNRPVKWPLLILAGFCLIPAVWGGLWAWGGDEGGEALGLAVLGFFGAGVVVLVQNAFRRP